MIKRETFNELIRFVIVGTISTALHYGIYWVLQHWMNVNIAYTIGYALSFLCNYYLSAYFTTSYCSTSSYGWDSVQKWLPSPYMPSPYQQTS